MKLVWGQGSCLLEIMGTRAEREHFWMAVEERRGSEVGGVRGFGPGGVEFRDGRKVDVIELKFGCQESGD